MSNPADLSYMMYLADDEKARQRAIVKARRYHEGHQYAALTDRMREFLGIHPGPQSSTTGGMYAYKDDYISPFVFNVSRIVVNAVTERMIVAGFDTDEPNSTVDSTGHPTPLETPVADWAWKLWLDNRMDAKADEAQTGAIRDGEYFVIVDWDQEHSRARFTAHPRYTDAQDCDGDGFGCKAFYPDDDDSQPMLYATKRWTAHTTDAKGRRTTDQRCNIYYPDRIEQLILRGGAWDTFAPPIRWRDRTGMPLGIAVIHMRNVELRPEAWDAFPLQDALNKGLIDLIASADLTAFRTGVAFGWYPTEDGQAPEADGSNAMRLSPGAIFGTMNKDGRLEWNDGADLNTLITPIQNIVLWMSMVTDTPIARFTTTKQVAAEGTLKQQEGPLLGKIRKRQALIGNAWEDCLGLALRLENAFGQGGLDPLIEVSTRWEPAETRDELAERQGLQIEAALGVPESVIWKKLGYSPSEIDAMLDQKEQAAQADMERQIQLIQARPAPMLVTNGKEPTNGTPARN